MPSTRFTCSYLCLFVMIGCFFVMNSLAMRYALMPCDIPVGDVKISQFEPTAADCSQLCSDANWPGLTFDTTSGACNCINVTGYAAPVGSEDGYVVAHASITSCPTCAASERIVRDLVFNNGSCPLGFFVWKTIQCANNYKLTQAQCANYSPWYSHYNASYGACVINQ